MEAKHTPGPWEIKHDFHHPEQVLHVVGPSEVVVGLDGVCSPHRFNDRSFDEDKANMVLVSAAPELLDVVRAFVAETVDYMTLNKLGDPENQHNVKWARQVIAKATRS